MNPKILQISILTSTMVQLSISELKTSLANAHTRLLKPLSQKTLKEEL